MCGRPFAVRSGKRKDKARAVHAERIGIGVFRRDRPQDTEVFLNIPFAEFSKIKGIPEAAEIQDRLFSVRL